TRVRAATSCGWPTARYALGPSNPVAPANASWSSASAIRDRLLRSSGSSQNTCHASRLGAHWSSSFSPLGPVHASHCCSHFLYRPIHSHVAHFTTALRAVGCETRCRFRSRQRTTESVRYRPDPPRVLRTVRRGLAPAAWSNAPTTRRRTPALSLPLSA